MFKRALLLLLAIPIAVAGLLWAVADMPPGQLPAAAALGTGLGAKLTCSGRYLSGFDDQRLEDDLATYSGLTRQLTYRALPGSGVEATLFGLSPAVAQYREGLGCALQYGDGALLDAVRVPAATPSPALPWPGGHLAGATDPALQALLDNMVAADNTAGLDTRALLVVRDGRLLAEAYGPGIDRDTPLLGWSMAKSVTAIMIGRLEAMGLAHPDERDLFPAWSGDERAAISLRNMLQMASGLDFSEEYVPGNDSTRMLFMSPSAAQVALESPQAHPAGRHFSYSSGTTNLLSRLAFERVGGSAQAQANFFHREIARPLGLEATTFEADDSGIFVGSSYLYAPARDWARFGQLLIDDGRVGGQRLLPVGWVKRATRPNTTDNYRNYGYQLWLNAGNELSWPSLPPDAYAMQGNRKQVVMMLPRQRAVIVRLGWSPGEYPIDENFARIVEAL